VTSTTTAVGDELPVSNKAKTLAWRDDVIRYARSRGVPAGRPLHSVDSQDAGEIDGIPGWTLLCRRRQLLDIASAVRQARERADGDGSQYAVAVLYARARPVGDAYAVMSLRQLLDLINEAGRNSR
jgi:hypothetical protein